MCTPGIIRFIGFFYNIIIYYTRHARLAGATAAVYTVRYYRYRRYDGVK